MGGKSSRNSVSDTHPVLGSVKYFDKNGQRLIEKAFTIRGGDEADEYKKLLASKNFSNQERLFLPITLSKETSGMCGTAGFLKAEYPNYSHTLETEILDRQLTKKDFKEVQLWYLLKCISSAGSQMQARNTCIGDLRPQNILANDQGDMKVFTQYSAPSQLTILQKSFQSGDRVYLAPEDIQQLANRNPVPANNRNKAEVFSAAVILLETGSKVPAKLMYRDNLISGLQAAQSTVKSKYSQFLNFIISKMTQKNPQDRPYFSEIRAVLAPFKQKIVKLESFQPELGDSINSLNKLHSQKENLRSRALDDISQILSSRSLQFGERGSQFVRDLQPPDRDSNASGQFPQRFNSHYSLDSNFTFGNQGFNFGKKNKDLTQVPLLVAQQPQLNIVPNGTRISSSNTPRQVIGAPISNLPPTMAPFTPYAPRLVSFGGSKLPNNVVINNARVSNNFQAPQVISFNYEKRY